MISLVRNIVFMLGKRGDLRNKDVLLAPKFSSLIRISEFLSSCVLLFKKLVNYSHILFLVSIDPRVKPEGDRKESVSEGDRKESMPESVDLYEVMPRFGTNRLGIFELGKNINVIARRTPVFDVAISANANNQPRCSCQFCELPQHDNLKQPRCSRRIFNPPQDDSLNKIIGRSLEFFALQKIGMTLLVGIFFLFLLFPFSSYSATVFLPDAQNEEVFNSLSTPPVVGIDSALCEEIGYTYYSSGQCPAYHNQDTCVFSDKYLKCDAEGWCRDNGYTTTSCSSPKILDVQCPNNLSLYKTCSCPSDYAYSCSGTGYGSGSGTVCDGKYTSCNCSTYYSWNGSVCAHVHSYVCPSGYSASSSGMISPVSAAKVCQLSGCSSTSGACYKEGHTHSYSCPSGSYSSSSSCSNGTSGTVYKVCSCGATSSSKCYKCATCNSSSYNYCYVHSTCHGNCCTDGTYQSCDPICGGSGCSTSGDDYWDTGNDESSDDETSDVCATSHCHSYRCPEGSEQIDDFCLPNGVAGTVPRECSCGATSGVCYICLVCDANQYYDRAETKECVCRIKYLSHDWMCCEWDPNGCCNSYRTTQSGECKSY